MSATRGYIKTKDFDGTCPYCKGKLEYSEQVTGRVSTRFTYDAKAKALQVSLKDLEMGQEVESSKLFCDPCGKVIRMPDDMSVEYV